MDTQTRARLSLPALAVARPVTTAMLFLALVMLGILSFQKVPVQLFPNFVYPSLFVGAQYPGADPEQVEREILIPLEGEIARISGVAEINSEARQGGGRIEVKIHPSRDLEMAFLELQERVQAASEGLPHQSFVSTALFDTSQFAGFVAMLAVRGDADPDVLRRVAEQQVAPRIEGVDGVVQAVVTGGQGLSINVEIDPEEAAARGLTSFEIRNAVMAANRREVHVGHVTDGGRRFFVTLEGRLDSPLELTEVVVGPGPVLLRDVAQVSLGLLLDTRRVRTDGLPSVNLFVSKDETSNLLTVGNRVREAIEELNKDLERHGYVVEATFDGSDRVRQDIRRLVKLGCIGAALVILVLLLFLRDIRAVLIITLAIPVSVAIAGVGVWTAGLSIDVITLMGMALGVGMLVDNSIVALESIDRRRAHGMSVRDAARVGGTEVQRAMLAATATTVVVFLPVAWINSEMRSLWIDFALAILMPLVASLLVALWLVPGLAALLLSERSAGTISGQTLDSARLPWVWLRSLLNFGARRPLGALVSVLLLALFTLVVAGPMVLFFFVSQRPAPDRVEFALEMPAGTTIEETDRFSSELENLVKEIGGVEQVDAVVEDEVSHITALLFDKSEEGYRDINDVRRDIRRLEVPKGRKTLDQSLRASPTGDGGDGGEASILGFGASTETIVVRGTDHEVMQQVGLEVQERVEQLPQVAENSVNFAGARSRTEELQILPDREALALHGMSVQDLMQIVWSTRREVEQLDVPIRWFGEDIDVAVGISGGDERALEDIARIRLTTPDGASVAIEEIARARIDQGPRTIYRKDRSRELSLTFRFAEDQVQGADGLEQARRDVEEALASLHLPAGTTAVLEREDPAAELKTTLYLAFFLLYLVLAVTFESFTQPVVIILSVPLALIGVAWALAVTGSRLELTVFLALVVLAGIIVNGAILLVDRAQFLMRAHGFPPLRAVFQAVRDRTRPVLMTAATTVAGLAPLALKAGLENEIWPPFAIAVIGGVLFGTLLTLVIIPMGMLIVRGIVDILRELGWILAPSAVVLWAGVMYVCYWQLELVTGALWRWFWVFPTLPAFVLSAYAIIRARRRGTEARARPGHTGPRVALRNATKVYGQSGPFQRAFETRRRREARRAREGRAVWTRENARKDLNWELPAFGLILWLHSWFEMGFWLFWLTWLTWAAARRLLRDTGLWYGSVFRDAERSRWSGAWDGWAYRVARTVLFVAAVAYAHWRCELHWIFTTFYVSLCLIVYAIAKTGRAIKDGRFPDLEMDVPDETRRQGWVRRWRRLVSGVPVLGRRRERVKALQGVYLEIGDGMFGLLGPNGAGKTTMLRTVAGVLEPSRGVVRVEGMDVVRDRDLLQGRTGYLPQDSGLYDSMTARDYLHYHALLMGMEDRENRTRIVEEALESVGLKDRADEKVGGFSGGMRQRVGIARTLLDLPDLLVVDEPTVGLDPAERIRFRTLLARLARNRTVLFSTHVVEDVATACDRLAVMNHGSVQFVGTPEELRQTAVGSVWETRTDEGGAAALRARARVVHTQREETDDESRRMRVRMLAREKPVAEAVPVDPTLEDAYLLLVPPRGEGGSEEAVAHA